MKIWKICMLFYAGGATYLTIELLFRGRSYGSMFLAGGLCFLLIGQMNHVSPRLPLILRGIAGSLIVTMVEFAAGLLVNRDHAVWDYRNLPLQFRGQICVPYSLLWIPVSFLAAMLYGSAEKVLGTGKES